MKMHDRFFKMTKCQVAISAAGEGLLNRCCGSPILFWPWVINKVGVALCVLNRNAEAIIRFINQAIDDPL